VKPRPRNASSAYTLVEVLIGMTLALAVMSAALSSYSFLGRNLTRITHEETLEASARRTLQYFAQDVRMASGLSGTPSASAVVLTLPTANSTKTITYTYNSTGSAVTVSGFSVPATSLARIDSAGSGLVLHRNLLTCEFTYYDSSGNQYTSYTNYLIGLKQVAVTFTAQAGTSINGTLTPVHASASPRLLIRNKALLQ
jgi:type II secretory pathway component PulJ